VSYGQIDTAGNDAETLVRSDSHRIALRRSFENSEAMVGSDSHGSDPMSNLSGNRTISILATADSERADHHGLT